MSNIVKHTEPQAIERSNALQPTNVDEAMRMASALCASKLLPAGIQTPEAAFAIIVTGRELGLSAMQALRSVHIIKGKPTLSADLILALVKRNPACEVFQLVESTDKRAVYKTKRVGEDHTTMDFTMAEAAQAGLLGNENWKKYPKAMLRARCIAALARAVYPDVVLGIYEPDELVEQPKAKASAPHQVHEAVLEESGDHPAADSLAPELEASTLLERIDRAQTMGELLEAWSDFGAAKERLAPEHVEKIKSAKDARKAELSKAAA